MTDKSDYLVSAGLAKERLIRELEALRPRPIVLMGKTEAYANGIRESIELIRNTDLTDCQPQMSESGERYLGQLEAEEAAEIIAALRKLDPVMSPYKTAFTMENAARFIEELVGVIAPAPDQGSVRGYEPDCADCPTPEDCRAKNDCQVMRQTRHGRENVFRRLYAEEAHKRAVESELAAERIAQLEADQGSVRNATDEQDAIRYRWLRDSKRSGPLLRILYEDSLVVPDSVDNAIDAAIRALPDQKD